MMEVYLFIRFLELGPLFPKFEYLKFEAPLTLHDNYVPDRDGEISVLRVEVAEM